ncbi:cupredoxin domain-containing protein [Blastococcus saxobsidens]|uniref:Copper binding protein, plastocyanin/azurin family n=1 Tax=Blastococcus saxobsidens (strain DD2) TaxID=1146883 RepID=H6RUV8_BLASD|nr:cupredoxin domain-containing protein [Blastococcus saxobsidens]CCG04480.1 Copper binding protein, plastocyanin/azurin family [Blastococcus saxobsidens DD2]
MSRSTRSRSGDSRRMPRTAATLVLAGTLAAASACGGSPETETADAAPTSAQSPSSSSPSSSTPSPSSSAAPSAAESAVGTITATEEDFSISVDQESVPAGSYEIEVVNAGGASHDLVVERDGEDVAATEILSPGDSGTVMVDLEPGEYIFYCSVGAHRAMGMEITIEVT